MTVYEKFQAWLARLRRSESPSQKDWTDQALHFTWAFIALLPVCISVNIWTGALAGFLIAAPREFVDQGRIIQSWPDTLTDIGFFMVGGAAVATLLRLIG